MCMFRSYQMVEYMLRNIADHQSYGHQDEFWRPRDERDARADELELLPGSVLVPAHMPCALTVPVCVFVGEGGIISLRTGLWTEHKT